MNLTNAMPREDNAAIAAFESSTHALGRLRGFMDALVLVSNAIRDGRQVTTAAMDEWAESYIGEVAP